MAWKKRTLWMTTAVGLQRERGMAVGAIAPCADELLLLLVDQGWWLQMTEWSVFLSLENHSLRDTVRTYYLYGIGAMYVSIDVV
jgi:hypothetical protein